MEYSPESVAKMQMQLSALCMQCAIQSPKIHNYGDSYSNIRNDKKSPPSSSSEAPYNQRKRYMMKNRNVLIALIVSHRKKVENNLLRSFKFGPIDLIAFSL